MAYFYLVTFSEILHALGRVFHFFVRISHDNAGELFASLLGAFFGAFAAFALQAWRESSLKKRDEYAAIINAQHAILFMWRILMKAKLEIFEPRETSPNRHRDLAKTWIVENHVSPDIKALGFLYNPNDTFMANIFFAERAYLNFFDAVSVRNQSWEEVIRSRIPNTETVEPGVKVTAVFDETSDSLLKTATDKVYPALDSALNLCENAFSELLDAAKIAQPKKNFLSKSNLTRERFVKDKVKSGLATQAAQ